MDWNVWGVPLVMLALVVLAGLVFITYIWCLVSAAKNGKWAWFVLMLLFQVLFIFYLLFADKSPPWPPAGRAAPRREPYFDA
ncbi:MAG: hypothetical protein EOP83_31210 [Verrucomicrobiaceae bacterium]|nr:MAG: hypothetical protein EOP83_31210 [Verrucomicrobiaceae bacterium]